MKTYLLLASSENLNIYNIFTNNQFIHYICGYFDSFDEAFNKTLDLHFIEKAPLPTITTSNKNIAAGLARIIIIEFNDIKTNIIEHMQQNNYLLRKPFYATVINGASRCRFKISAHGVIKSSPVSSCFFAKLSADGFHEEKPEQITFQQALVNQEAAYIMLEKRSEELNWQQKASIFYKHRTNQHFLMAIQSMPQYRQILIDIVNSEDSSAKKLILHSRLKNLLNDVELTQTVCHGSNNHDILLKSY